MQWTKDHLLRNIFIVKNYTLKENYFGATPKRVRQSLSDLRHHRIQATQHWDWKTQDIQCHVVSRHILAPIAVYRLWKLKKDKQEVQEGWKNV